MSYRIKEIYFTQQGEGSNTGRDLFSFDCCNLGSGKENRKSAICQFCDTDFMAPMVLMVVSIRETTNEKIKSLG